MEQLLVEFVAFAVIGAILFVGGIILSKFSRRSDNSGEKEKSDPEKYNKYGEATFWEPNSPQDEQSQ